MEFCRPSDIIGVGPYPGTLLAA